ncbi:MAG: TetR/AcrR family transcriptional regulator [Prevotellaceae bacterium]|jgi:AcrR family transcriptional regulator|nr:TetR/AcrR family transcriptional regulator [Prevotellaceae bacterium]
MKTSKEKIVDKATKEFMLCGYKGAVTEEIAKAAGLSNNSGLFRHFFDKEDLYYAVLEKYFLHAQTPEEKFRPYRNLSLKNFIERYVDKVEELSDFLHKLLGDSTEEKTNRYFSFLLECCFREKDCEETILLHNKQEIALWQGVIENAKSTREISPKTDSRSAAELFFYTFYGISVDLSIGKDASREQVRDMLYNLYDSYKA